MPIISSIKYGTMILTYSYKKGKNNDLFKLHGLDQSVLRIIF